MKNLLCLLLGVLFLSSCITQEKCLEKFPPQQTVRVDSVYKEKIEYVKRDTTIYVKGETVFLHSFVNCDSLGKAQMKKSTVIGGRISASAEIVDGNLNVICNEDSLFAVIAELNDKIHTITKEKKELIKETRILKNHEPTTFDIICYCLSSALVLFILFKRLKI